MSRASATPSVLCALLLASCAPGAGQTGGRPAEAPGPAESVYTPSAGDMATQLYWSDGDSGRINGAPFRLAGIDAPETGGVESRGGADCEVERRLGFAAKEWVVELTRKRWGRGPAVEVTATNGLDRYDRTAVSLSVDGRPLDRMGVAAGHYRPWPHRAGRAQGPKPDWCGGSGAGR